MFDHIGIAANLAPTLGIIEIAAAVLFLIPRTSFLGAILVTGYLGGAVWAHVRGCSLERIMTPAEQQSCFSVPPAASVACTP